jgi:hypothetical protein
MLKDNVSKLKELFRSRKRNYQLVFNKEDQAVLGVLKDLARFCRANESTFNKDPRIQANLDGRREVWLRITNHLQLNNEELYNLYYKFKE